MVGRTRELRSIGSFLDDTASSARVLLLVGDAGIGKTTVWRAAVDAARERGFRVLCGSPSAAESRLGFATIDDLLGAHVDEVTPLLPPPQARALAVALHRAEAVGAPPDPATTAFSILASVRALSATAPLVVAVDDVQWLDEPSAAALAFALRRVDDDEVRFVFAQRASIEVAPPLGLERYPEDRVTRVDVGPLSLGAIGAVVTDRLGTALARPVLRRVHATANGNPLFALELARALLSRGGHLAPGEPLPVPTNLDELLAARLVELPAETRAALLVVAAARGPTIRLVAEALEIDDSGARIEPAVDAHVLELDDDRVRFTHPLLAAVVYARADAGARRGAHRALARVTPSVEERARHLALATRPPDERVALELDDAARAAAARGSPAGAAELSELAARFTGVDLVDEQRRRLCDAADNHLLAGDARRSTAVASPLAQDTPAGVHRARALYVLSFAEADTAKRIAWLEQAALEGAAASELAARINHWLSLLALIFRSVDEGREYAARALALSGTSAARARSAAVLVLADLAAGVPPDDELLEEALELELESGASLYYGPSTVRALRYTFADRPNEARPAFDAAARRAAEHGDEPTLAGLLVHRAELECRAGNFELAARHADEGYAISRQIGMPDRVAVLAFAQALAHGFLGDVVLTRAKAAEAPVLPGYWEIRTRAVLGLLELSRGDVTAAAEQLRPVPDRLLAMGFGEAWSLDGVPAAIEALVGLGQLGEAERLLDLYAERVMRSAYGRAATARSRGIVAAGRGRLDEAFDALTMALRQHDTIDTPFERARTLLALGRVERRARRRRSARETLAEARDSFRQLGARLWAERAEEELGRLGGRPSSRGELTPSERRIAALVAEGKTNKEVAAVLVVADRTVESALTHIYRKLHVRSRTELARKLASVG
jgi:DNA-binding CsgD family transcriptional regulator